MRDDRDMPIRITFQRDQAVKGLSYPLPKYRNALSVRRRIVRIFKKRNTQLVRLIRQISGIPLPIQGVIRNRRSRMRRDNTRRHRRAPQIAGIDMIQLHVRQPPSQRRSLRIPVIAQRNLLPSLHTPHRVIHRLSMPNQIQPQNKSPLLFFSLEECVRR